MFFLYLMLLMNEAGSDLLTLEKAHGDDPDGIIWGVGTNLAVVDEKLYVLDPNSFQVRVLNADFEEQAVIGRRGKGPGEFEEPKTITRTPDGNLAVFDPTLKRMSLFKPDGELITTKKLPAPIVGVYQPTVLKGGEVAFLAPTSADGKPVYDLSIHDPELKPVKSLVRLTVPSLDWSKSSNPSFWVGFLKYELELLGRGMPVVTALDDQTFAVARSDRARISLVDAKGAEQRAMTFETERKFFSPDNKDAAFREVWARLCSDAFLANNMTEAVFRRASEQAEIPEVLPLVRTMVPMAGGLAVLVNYEDHRRQGRWLLLNQEGKQISATDYRGPASFVTSSGKLMYAVGPDADDNIIIQRLRWTGPAVD